MSLRLPKACFAAAPCGVFSRGLCWSYFLHVDLLPLQWDGQGGGGDQGSDAVQALPGAGVVCPVLQFYMSICEAQAISVCLALLTCNVDAADPTLQDMDIDDDLQQAMALSMQVSFPQHRSTSLLPDCSWFISG